MLARMLTLVAIGLVLSGPAAQSAPATAPTDLRAFLLRADEPTVTSFPRTPAFAWHAFGGAVSYDFQLATSRKFDERTIVWSTASRSEPLQVPAVTIPISLPWMSGHPYAFYTRVRAHTTTGVTRWSTPYGFNMQWASNGKAQKLPDIPGLVRWSPIEGASSYEVWFVNAGKVITTTTNVADEREYYSFHQAPSWSGIVEWRVRAVRKLYGALPNSLPSVSYGPWSDPFVSVNPSVTSGLLGPVDTVSDAVSTNSGSPLHSLTPGFAFSGDTAVNGSTGQLYRVYVATDPHCVNVVFKGAVVGSPAYAPRTSGPLALPTDTTSLAKAQTSFLPNGQEAGTFTAENLNVTTDEQTATGASSGTPAVTSTGSTTTAIPADFTTTGPFVDLWDLGSPNSRFYWTVVPVRVVVTDTGVQYYEEEVPQDACEAGHVMEFAKTTAPALTSTTRPFVSGLSGAGDLVAARTMKPAFYRTPLVAWEPVPGAIGYEVQWSKTKAPWRSAAATPLYTAATSALLEGLTPGVWYYRVRGIDPYIPGPIKQMAWSAPVRIRLSKSTFVVESGVTTQPAP